LWIKDGRLQETILTGISYAFQKGERENSELIYVKAGNFKVEWGIPIRNGVFNQHGEPIGCHGIMVLKVKNVQNLIFNFVSSLTGEYLDVVEKEVYLAGKKGEKKRDAILKEKVSQDIIDVREAQRVENPFLVTVKDIKSWVVALIRAVLKQEFASRSTEEINALSKEDLESAMRVGTLKEFTQWGLEMVSFTIMGIKTMM